MEQGPSLAQDRPHALGVAKNKIKLKKNLKGQRALTELAAAGCVGKPYTPNNDHTDCEQEACARHGEMSV